MRRKLCEFYRDRGYPDHWAFEYWCEDEYGSWIVTTEPYDPATAIPTIPGLLAFLREKLGRNIMNVVIDRWQRKLQSHLWTGGDAGEAVVMLAEDGKAALEALDDN